ncbi:protein of unknown function [Arachidicoccus rhizosphaerae]|uniref:DUF4133 domain-containing protein n=1 Tax=Arachidicoccus rhizosphaerae TaxID=551991 RepID=A0A1H4AC14_9BACT|nr:DUF4133 domain-containing protein [Arachidicoccus rhizosphaerae]SEA33082.1 protein of unknown function [Arachidicoccus rhizosphaerae]
MQQEYSFSYKINKGVNRSIEFKGLKAQYIYYLAIGLALLLLVFAVLYMLGLSAYLDLGLTLCLGAALFITVNKLNVRYGVHGLKKRLARRKFPVSIRPVRITGPTTGIFRELSSGKVA